MPDDRLILTCTCEGTMPVDGKALEKAGCGRIAGTATQLCRAGLDRFRAALAEGAPVTVACTQEQALFGEVADEAGFTAPLAFANIRETGGWSDEARASGPKAAALIAAAAEDTPPVELIALESQGVALVLGADEAALEAAAALAESLDITVLLLPGAGAAPPRRTTFPVLQGRIRKAQGHLGAFEMTVDDYAAYAPSSRGRLEAGEGRDGAVSRCDLVVDLTGGMALFPAGRPGYLRADPRDPVAGARLIHQAAGLVGTFDKPRFVNFAPDLCAHSRNRLTGCTRCLDLCPTGAIASAGDTVEIDPAICLGCGQCAAACPTGAAGYALPTAETLVRRLRAMLRAFRAAGGAHAPVILLHDEDHGSALIDASARFGRGLPAHVLPLHVNEITQTGPETLAAAFAYGAGGVSILSRARPRHDLGGLKATLALTGAMLAAMGRDPAALELIETDDPDALEASLRIAPAAPGPAATGPSSFLPPEDKRGLLTTAMLELNRTAPAPADRIALPDGAPFGAVVLDADACTLCHACTGACPTAALTDNPELPMLRFTESLCVQCGICAATCPENAITLTPRIDFPAWETPRRILKEEEPFCCTACGKAFGAKSSIERVQEKLSAHWMFAGEEGEAQRRALTMCEDCRVEAMVNAGFDPHGDTPQRRVRTAADYRNGGTTH